MPHHKVHIYICLEKKKIHILARRIKIEVRKLKKKLNELSFQLKVEKKEDKDGDGDGWLEAMNNDHKMVAHQYIFEIDRPWTLNVDDNNNNNGQ